MRKYFFVLMLMTGLFSFNKYAVKTKRILVFSKTEKFRHQSIEAGKKMFLYLGKKYHVIVDTTEDATSFNPEQLKKYNAVVFLNTTGTVFNDEQKNAFRHFIENGGGFVGVHAATDTEYDWPWYNQLSGAYFANHPKPQQVTYHIIDKNFPATKGLPDSLSRLEEIYNFKSLQKDSLHFLITADEHTYSGGTMGDFHPAAWYHDFDGGRAFYIAWGHFPETYSESMFQNVIWQGVEWAMKK